MLKKVTFLLTHLLVAVAASVLTLALFLPQQGPVPGNTKLQQLQALIEERFIGEADKTKMENAAANAMIQSLGDRWSYYISAEEFAGYMEQMKNAYVGIGVTIQNSEGDHGFEIIAVTEGGPAEKAGIKPGDILTRVENQSVELLGMDATRNIVRGEEGTKVKITIRRGDEMWDLSVMRQSIQTIVASYELLDGDIGLITIANFDDRCASETIAAIEAVIGQGAKSLIFDVRNNPGGYAHELTKVLDYLLPKVEIFHTVDYTGNEDVVNSDENFLKMPMAVLVNGNSYSAAEFFAATLSYYDWATTVGEATVGKGYFQKTYSLGDGSAVGLSVGKYFTPDGSSLEGVGIQPDAPVPVDEETAAKIYYNTLPAMEDPQVLAAIATLREK